MKNGKSDNARKNLHQSSEIVSQDIIFNKIRHAATVCSVNFFFKRIQVPIFNNIKLEIKRSLIINDSSIKKNKNLPMRKYSGSSFISWIGVSLIDFK